MGGTAQFTELMKQTVRENSVKTIVEVGVCTGVSTRAFMSVLPEDGHMYSIDIVDLDSKLKQHSIQEHWDNWEFINGNDLEVVKDWNKEIDFLFLDGEHAGRHVKAELLAWGQHVKHGGIIMIHDTNIEDELDGILDFFRKLPNNNRNFEMKNVSTGDSIGDGMMIIRKLWK